ncbi:MAG: hypothetical protein B7Y53_00830 [Halothiobacillus sp. 28-55-5]|nr:MAG: hypothetical protein B7Y53_00830 [Halothiobacillus sp. 28-55-5]
MTTVSNKLTDGLDKVRDNKPVTPASNAQPAPPAEPKAPVRRKPVAPKVSQSEPLPVERKTVIHPTRVWPD